MRSICEWKPSAIFPDYYEVSSDGQVYSKRSGKTIRPNTDKDGYLYYVLCVKGDRKTIKAHRLVAQTFIPNLGNKPSIDHINGNKTDNRVENLRWVSNKENSHNPLTLTKLRANAKQNLQRIRSLPQTYGRNHTLVYKDGCLIGEFESQKAAAVSAGVSQGKVSQCVSGQKTSCKGYVFKTV